MHESSEALVPRIFTRSGHLERFWRCSSCSILFKSSWFVDLTSFNDCSNLLTTPLNLSIASESVFLDDFVSSSSFISVLTKSAPFFIKDTAALAKAILDGALDSLVDIAAIRFGLLCEW